MTSLKPQWVLYDAHNHLQDERLLGVRDTALAQAVNEGLVRAVVNGSCEEDWPEVAALARAHREVLPSFGVHPWYVKTLSPRWQEHLLAYLEPGLAAVGEIGLDRWVKDYDLPRQEEVFLWQWRWAAQHNRPVTIHCLRAWGRLLEWLRAEPGPACGFLLHSYGGPAEMVGPLADLGAYFSISGYFAHDRKARQRETFKQIPPDRLLLETDAPDMWPPEEWNDYPYEDSRTGQPANHPANLGAVYRFVAAFLEEPLEKLAARVEQNFYRLFGGPRVDIEPKRKVAS